MRKFITISFIGLLLLGCKKETFDIQNLNGNQIFALGHAGMGISDLYPINSAESIANCLALGADGSEMDIQMTKDSVLVLFHDEYMDGSTNFTGKIHDYTRAELQNAHYTNVPYNTYAIVALEDLFNGIGNYIDFKLTLDIKLNPSHGDYSDYTAQFAQRLKAFFDQFNAYGTVFIESQSESFLATLQSMNSNFMLYHYPQTFEEGMSVVQNLGIRGISIDNDVISAEQVSAAHALNIYVTIWGVNSKDENSDAIRKNPDMIQTDKMKNLLSLLE